MTRRILIANRGAAAARIRRTVEALGREPVFVASPADAGLPYLRDAEWIEAPGNRAQESYLDQAFILDAASRLNAEAIHPGYGFLSENAEFAERVIEAGMLFIGPSPETIRQMGEKTRALEIMAGLGLPVAPGSGRLGADADIAAEAERIGYPLLIKPANGGGGIGMLPVRAPENLSDAVERARKLAARAFGSDEIFLERLIERPRHIEFQVYGDGRGAAGHLWERDCSVQRRHQKVIEETTAPGLPREEIEAMAAIVTRAVAGLNYGTIGTVEMLWTPGDGFSFLEMNTRLQVEHAVTEEVTGTDLVAIQIRLAEGESIEAAVPERRLQGHAVEARIYAEDPVRHLPSPGPLNVFSLPDGDGVRIETGYCEGAAVTPYYDPMIAKVIATGTDRREALSRLDAALVATRIEGIKTNIPLLRRILADGEFMAGRVHTSIIAGLEPARELERT